MTPSFRLRRLLWVAGVVAAVAWGASSGYPTFVDDISSPERPEVIEDIDRAQFFHGHLEGTQVDHFSFEANPGDEVVFEALVPKTDELRDFRPLISLSGPGLPAEGVVPPRSAAPVSRHEGFTQTYYWSYAAPGELDPAVSLSEGGTYEVTVEIDRGEGGPYALVSGEEQSLGPTDVLLFPLDWVRVRLWYFG